MMSNLTLIGAAPMELTSQGYVSKIFKIVCIGTSDTELLHVLCSLKGPPPPRGNLVVVICSILLLEFKGEWFGNLT